MGYRNYIASIPRKEYTVIKNMTKKELYHFKGAGEDDYVGVYNVAYNQIYELGKYVDEFPKRLFKPVFSNKNLQSHFVEEHDFYLVGKKFLENVINRYSKLIKTYYDKMLDGVLNDDKFPKIKDIEEIDKVKIYEILKHIQSMGFEWGCSKFSDTPPFKLDGDKITNSCKYEYAIFELIRIYKTFDWKNNVMIYYGY